MNNAPGAITLSDISTALESTGLACIKNPVFLKRIQTLVNQHFFLQNDAQEQVRRLEKDELRPVMVKVNQVLRLLDKVRKQLTKTQGQAETLPVLPWHWTGLFASVDHALANIELELEQIRQRAIDHLHPSLARRTRKELPRFDLLLKRHDYPLDRLGHRRAETWFIGEFDKLISEKCKGIRTNEKLRLIQALFANILKEGKGLKTIEVAVSRARKARINNSEIK